MDLLNSVQPFLVWLRIVGMFPVSDDKLQTKKTSAQKLIHEIFFINSLLVATFLAGLNLSFVSLKNVWNFAMIFGFFNYFVTFINQRLKRRAIWNFLSLLHNIDQKVFYFTIIKFLIYPLTFQLLLNNFTIKYKKQRNFIFFYSASMILTIAIFSTLAPITFLIKNEGSWTDLVPSFCFFQNYMFSFIFQLTFAAFGVRERLKLLNNSLR